MSLVSVTFVVNAVAAKSESETVCLVGSGSRLGAWNPSKCIQLHEIELHKWSCTVPLDAGTAYSYRYFVCRNLKNTSAGCDTVMDVVQWETHNQCRQFQTGQEKSLSIPDAIFGSIDGVQSESIGWLMDSVFEVHVRLHGNPIKIRKAGEGVGDSTAFMVRCMPVHHAHSQASQEDSSLTYADVLVSNLSCKDSHPRLQELQGAKVDQEDFVVFRHRTSCLSSLGFLLEISTCGKSAAVIGSSHLLPDNLPDSQQVLFLPIIDADAKCVGSVKVDVLVGRPATGMTFDMESCDQSYWHWRNHKQSLDGGHRGMGASFSVANPHKENTVASFDAAYNFGADFIETDILLTKDLIPVIFHDFNTFIAMKNTRDCQTSCQLHSTPIHDMTLEEIRCKKFFTSKGVEINDEEPPLNKKCSPFPTLEEILRDVEPGLAFDLEVKYPQMEVNGEMEGEVKIDPNTYVDAILKVIYQHDKDRRIFFSTFQPEICTLLKLKQSRYPVAFLSQGETKMYTNYQDFRCATFPHSINFAISEGLLGMALHTELLLSDKSLVDHVLNSQLALFVWGLHNNDPKIINMFREWKVDGVIYDRMDLYRPQHDHKSLLSNDDGANGSNNHNNSNNTSPQCRRQMSGGGVGGSPRKQQRL